MIEILNQPQLFVLLHLQAIKAAYIIYHVATYLALHDSVYILKWWNVKKKKQNVFYF